MQAFKGRLSKTFNKHLNLSGPLFPERYHVEVLTTPTQTLNGLL